MTEGDGNWWVCCWSNRDSRIYLCALNCFSTQPIVWHTFEKVAKFRRCPFFFDRRFGDSSWVISVSSAYIRLRFYATLWFWLVSLFAQAFFYYYFFSNICVFESSHFLHFINFRWSRIHFDMRIKTEETLVIAFRFHWKPTVNTDVRPIVWITICDVLFPLDPFFLELMASFGPTAGMHLHGNFSWRQNDEVFHSTRIK